MVRKQESKTTETAPQDEIPSVASMDNPVHKYTKKSEMSEKGQIKFMKSLLGKVKTLLHRDNGKKKKGKWEEKKLIAYKIPEKINAATSDSKTNTLYGVLGNSKEKDGEKSVNVISIPLEALKKIAPSAEDDLERGKDPGDFVHMDKGTQVVLKPVSVRLATMGENKRVSPLVPVILPSQVPRMVPLRSANFFPDGPNGETFGTPRLPYMMRRHEGILKDNKGDERLFQGSKGDDGLYRDIGHIPGEIRFHHRPLEDKIQTRRPNLRHRNPVRYHRVRDDYDDDNDIDDDGDDDDEDEDDFDDEDDDDNDELGYRHSPRMLAEERQIAATRKRLFDMLPGNDPTYTSENRGLGLPMRPDMMMQMPEAFLGNPMVQPGAGVNQRTMMPLLGAALAGEHADNSNDRSVFMFGGQGSRRVYGDSDNTDVQDTAIQPSAMRVNSGGFTLGGSRAQSMSPNEVSYMLQKPGFQGQLSEKDKITRPNNQKHGGVLLKVNGHPIGDSRELRDHVVNGMVLKGKEKLIKSKGPMDVKVSKATDGVHSKVVDITSSNKVKVLEAKSKIAKSR